MFGRLFVAVLGLTLGVTACTESAPAEQPLTFDEFSQETGLTRGEIARLFAPTTNFDPAPQAAVALGVPPTLDVIEVDGSTVVVEFRRYRVAEYRLWQRCGEVHWSSLRKFGQAEGVGFERVEVEVESETCELAMDARAPGFDDDSTWGYIDPTPVS